MFQIGEMVLMRYVHHQRVNYDKKTRQTIFRAVEGSAVVRVRKIHRQFIEVELRTGNGLVEMRRIPYTDIQKINQIESRVAYEPAYA